MDEGPYHAKERELQERFDSTRLADRLAQFTYHDSVSERDAAYLAQRDMFFLATSDAEGNLDCSYKGGDPGFVRVIDEKTIVFPMYDGNGMFNSAGNILSHAKVGMLFIDWEHGWRMRINGSATIDFEHPLMSEYPEAQFLVLVTVERVYPNCPRYIHRMQLVERSKFVPHADCETPDHEWKNMFEDALPKEQQERRAAKREREAQQ